MHFDEAKVSQSLSLEYLCLFFCAIRHEYVHDAYVSDARIWIHMHMDM